MEHKTLALIARRKVFIRRKVQSSLYTMGLTSQLLEERKKRGQSLLRKLKLPNNNYFSQLLR